MLAPKERNPGTRRDKGKACPVVSAAGATRAAEGRAGPCACRWQLWTWCQSADLPMLSARGPLKKSNSLSTVP